MALRAALRGQVAVGVLALATAAAALAGCGGKKRRAGAGSGDGGAGVILVDPRKLSRAEVAEVEPNDDREHAQLLPQSGADLGAAGSFAGPKDSDWYAFEVAPGAERRVVAVTLPGVPGVDLGFALLGPGNVEIARVDDAKPGDGEAVPNFGLAPGRYLLEVRQVPLKKSKKGAPDAGVVAGATYHVGLRVTEPVPGDELEPNDAPAFATALAPGDAVSGYLGWRKDVDVYKIPLDAVQAAGALRVEVDAPAGVAPTLTLLDATEARLLERTGRAGTPLIARGLAPRPGDPYAFVAVSAGSGKSTSAEPDQKYVLRVEIDTVAPGDEREPNDTPESALPLVQPPGDAVAAVPAADVDGRAAGMLTAGDVDVYKLRVAAGQLARVELAVGPGPEDAKADLSLTLLGEGGKAARTLDEGGAKVSEILTSWAFPVEDDLLLAVRAKVKTGEVAYRLTWAVSTDDGKREREPNDDAAHATPLAEDSPVSASIDSKTDADFFRIAGASSSAIALELGGVAGLQLNAQLLDDKRKLVTEVAGAPGAALVLRATIDPARTYTVRVAQLTAKAKPGRPQTPYEITLRAE